MKITVLILLAMGLVACGCATEKLTNGVPNLVAVAPCVWRGGQPTAEGWAFLKRLGVKNVVKLNEDAEGSDAMARELGMRVLPFPISLPEQLGLKRVTLDTNLLGLVFDQLNEDAKVSMAGVFIHCEHGEDRTGVAVGYWRLRENHFSKAAAEKEMLEHGFHQELRGLWEYWERL